MGGACNRHTKPLVGNAGEKDNLEDLGVDGWVCGEIVEWIHVA
jgi:hypothetical protein